MGTTGSTIKIHCNNVYRRRGIGSQTELFSLFVDCIPFAMPEASVDPLEPFQCGPTAPRMVSMLDVAPLKA